MKRILKVILSSIVLSIVSCTSYRYVTYNQYDGYFTRAQVDSICISEGIPCVGEGWKFSGFMDVETMTPVKQYFYVIDHDSINIVYTA